MKNELIAEKKKWYKILKDSGFKDIEYFDRNMEPFNICYPCLEIDKETYIKKTQEMTEEYYRLATLVIEKIIIANNRTEKRVLKLLKKGLEKEKIVNKFKKLNTEELNAIIRRLEKRKIIKKIWILHTEGLSYREIAKEINCSKTKVEFNINKIKNQFINSDSPFD